MKTVYSEEKCSKLRAALKQIHLRVQVQVGRTLTHDELAELAGVGKRSIGDWMRGVSAPPGMSAILELLSQLDEDDVIAVLREWRNASSSDVTKSRGPNSRPRQVGHVKAEHSHKTAIKKSTANHRGK